MARANGEGSVSQREDGRWEASAFFNTASGQRRRRSFYGKTRSEAHTKLIQVQSQAIQGIPIADKDWKLGEYLDYWLNEVVRPTLRPKTFELYEGTVRLYLKPGLGKNRLTQLTVPMVQSFLNAQANDGLSIRRVQIIRTTLSSALTNAQREEAVGRNVARLVRLRQWKRKPIRPWTTE